jgi:hypothetical protein
VHKATELPKEEFKRGLERHLTGQKAEPGVNLPNQIGQRIERVLKMPHFIQQLTAA